MNPTEEIEINSFQIDYRHEVQKGDFIKLYTKKDENFALIKGVNNLGETAFICKLQTCGAD